MNFFKQIPVFCRILKINPDCSAMSEQGASGESEAMEDSKVDKITSQFSWDQKTVIWEILNMSVAVGPPPATSDITASAAVTSDTDPQEYRAMLDIDFMNSFSFQAGKHDQNKSNWSLSLSKTSADYLGLFIHLRDIEAGSGVNRWNHHRHSFDGLYFKYNMSVFNVHGQVARKIENSTIINLIPGQSWGEEDFILIRNLWSPEVKLLDENEKLVLRVDLFLFSQLNHSVDQVDADSVPGQLLWKIQAQDKSLKNNILSTLWDKKEFTDVKINCGGWTFSVHKCIIAAASPVFRAMFSTEMSESKENQVDICDVEPPILELLLSFMYSGNVVGREWMSWDWNNLDKVTQLIDAAEKYGVMELKELCFVNVCGNIDKLDGAKVGWVVVTMKMYNAHKDVMEFVFSYVMRNIKRLREDKSFIQVVSKNAEAFADVWMSEAIAAKCSL